MSYIYSHIYPALFSGHVTFMAMNSNELNSLELRGGERMMQLKITTDRKRETHTVTQPGSQQPVRFMHGQKSDRSIELRREGEEDSAAVMICDVFTAATCSRLVNQTPTHTDEPHLRGAGALLQIHPAAQQEAAVAIVTARSTGGVCGSESVH